MTTPRLSTRASALVAITLLLAAAPAALAAGPFSYYALTPCRVADTRGNGFTGTYGTPSLVAYANRSFTIGGQCGVPADAAAVTFNFTIVNTTSDGDLRVVPAGITLPVVSTLNWIPATTVIANGALVPLGTAGAITVHNDGSTPVDLVIDVTGYFK